MRILIGCEFSGTVREAFQKISDANEYNDEIWSCDILNTHIASTKHYHGDIRDIIHDDWDMLIAFPPCTYLTKAAAHMWKTKSAEHEAALEFVRYLMAAPIEKIAIENPVGAVNSKIRKPDQIISPHEFGHRETKTTCLWLKNLPPLIRGEITVPWKRKEFVNSVPGRDPWKWMRRAKTFQGIADAMATQWR